MGDAWSALADPTRREILNLLRKGNMNAGEIAAQFSLSKPSISHHLNILRQADLVRSEKTGQNIVYSINTSVLEELLYLIAKLSGKEDAK